MMQFAELPSHQAYESALRWYGRSIVALLIAVGFAFGLSKLAPGVPLAIPMIGFLPAPILLGIGLRQMWRMVHLRRQEIADGIFAGSPKYLLFMDQHAIAISVGVFIIAIVIGIANHGETLNRVSLEAKLHRPAWPEVWRFISVTIDYSVRGGWGHLSG
jgi:hypothetical protein